MDEEPGDVLTIQELSAYLMIPRSTLYKLVRKGKIPCQEIGRWLEETHGDTNDGGNE